MNQNYQNYHSTSPNEFSTARKATRTEKNKYQIMYGVDATKLEQIFSIENRLLCNRTIFNFPHWVSKSNHRKKRQLINDLFISSSKV